MLLERGFRVWKRKSGRQGRFVCVASMQVEFRRDAIKHASCGPAVSTPGGRGANLQIVPGHGEPHPPLNHAKGVEEFRLVVGGD
ncbi:hypothetical protein MHYP_G00126980 [Metynnis hypsauchen]